jgi:hypothetical protein
VTNVPGHVGLAQLERDDDSRGPQCGAECRRVGRVVGVDTAHDQSAQLPSGDRVDDRVRVPPRLIWEAVDAPGGGRIDARRGVGDRASARQEVRQASGLECTPVAGTAGHPGEPRPRRAREPGDRGERARDGRHPLADQDHARGAELDVIAFCQPGDDITLGSRPGGDQ